MAKTALRPLTQLGAAEVQLPAARDTGSAALRPSSGHLDVGTAVATCMGRVLRPGITMLRRLMTRLATALGLLVGGFAMGTAEFALLRALAQ